MKISLSLFLPFKYNETKFLKIKAEMISLLAQRDETEGGRSGKEKKLGV